MRVELGRGKPLPSVGGVAATHRVRVVGDRGERSTTIHVARWSLDALRVRLVLLDAQRSVEAWCREAAVAEAINGGYFTKPLVEPLGAVAIDGETREHQPFVAPWDERRSALWIAPDGRTVAIARREQLDDRLARDGGAMLQAAPLLVADGVAVVEPGDEDPEGLRTTCAEFDSDITAEPLPRMAVAVHGRELVGVAVDGRSGRDEGLLLDELAAVLVALGVDAALALDGGSSAALVTAGARRNHPRDDVDHELLDGYPTATLLAIEPVGAASVAAHGCTNPTNQE